MKQQLLLLESNVLTFEKPYRPPSPSKQPVITFGKPPSLKRSTPEGLITEAEQSYYDGLIVEDHFKFLDWPVYNKMPVVPTEPPTLKHLAQQAVSPKQTWDVLHENPHQYKVLGLRLEIYFW